MDRRNCETVFFIKNLSLEEEYEIVHSPNKDFESRISPKLNRNIKVTGNAFYQIEPMLYESKKIKVKEIGKKDRDILSLITALVFMPPFHNLLFAFKEQETDRFYETDIIRKVHYVFEYFLGTLTDIPVQKYPALDLFMSSDFSNIHKLYDELLKEMHEELIKRHVFTEHIWKDASTKHTKINKLYDEYSPIVDLFHLKIKRYQTLKNRNIELDFQNSIEVDFKKTSFKKVLEQFENFESKFVITKHPHILSFKLTNGEDFVMPSRIKIMSKEYELRSFVGKKNEESFVLIYENKWYKLGSKKEQLDLDRVDGIPWMCFYLAIDYEFD